jgi:hypothetical protein
MGDGLLIGFTEHLQIITKSNYGAIASSQTLHFTTARNKSSQRVMSSAVYASVFTSLSAGECLTSNFLLFSPPSQVSTELTKLPQVEVDDNLRPTVSRTVCFGPDFCFLSENCVSLCGATSLTRGWVCNLLVQLLLGLARAVTFGSNHHRTLDHVLLSHMRLPQPGRPGPRI